MALWKQVLVSAALLAVSGLLYALVFTGGSDTGQPSASGRPPPLVVLDTVGSGAADTAVRSIGTAQAIDKTTLYPESAGRIDWIGVTAGQRVAQDDLILRLDDRVERIAVERARLAVADAEAALDRYRTLSESNAVSAVQLRDAQLVVEKAALDLQEAEDALARREIRAPFTGDIGLIDVGVGDYVTTATPVASLDDRRTIVIAFRVPERFANQIERGQIISLSTPALPGRDITGEIADVDSRIDPVSRTLTIQGTVDNQADTIRPGMSFEVSLALPGNRFASVPSPAVQWDSGGSYVFKTDGNTASRVPVEIVSRQDGIVLVRGEVAEGDEIIVEGVDSVRPGRPFRTQAIEARTLASGAAHG